MWDLDLSGTMQGAGGVGGFAVLLLSFQRLMRWSRNYGNAKSRKNFSNSTRKLNKGSNIFRVASASDADTQGAGTAGDCHSQFNP